MSQTSYMYKMNMHTLVQRLEDAATAKHAMEKYATNNDLQNCLNLEKIKKLIEAKEKAKRSMADFTRTQEETNGNTNKVSDYHKGKNLELQKSRDNYRSNGGTTGRSGTQPDTGPICTCCKYH